MLKSLRCVVLAAMTAGVASPAVAGELTVTMSNGRVSIIAHDVPVRQILAEWARIGNTRMINSEKLGGGPVTLQLVDVPEKEALDILLRSAAGYMTAPRPTGVVGASLYDRVIILPTSRAVTATVSAPPAAFGVNRPAFNQPPPQPPPPDDDDGDPGDQGPNGPPQGQPVPPGMQPFPGANPNVPGGVTGPPQGPITSPRPGILPQPQQPPAGNPYAPPLGPNGRPVQVPPGGRGGGPGPDSQER